MVWTFESRFVNLMVDCETLSTETNARVTSICFVPFDEQTYDVEKRLCVKIAPSARYLEASDMNEMTVAWRRKHNVDGLEISLESCGSQDFAGTLQNYLASFFETDRHFGYVYLWARNMATAEHPWLSCLVNSELRQHQICYAELVKYDCHRDLYSFVEGAGMEWQWCRREADNYMEREHPHLQPHHPQYDCIHQIICLQRAIERRDHVRETLDRYRECLQPIVAADGDAIKDARYGDLLRGNSLSTA